VFDSFTYRSYKSQPDDYKISRSTSYSFRSFIPSLLQFFYLSRSIPSLIANSKSLFNHLKLSSSKIPSIYKSKSLPISLFHLIFSTFLTYKYQKTPKQSQFQNSEAYIQLFYLPETTTTSPTNPFAPRKVRSGTRPLAHWYSPPNSAFPPGISPVRFGAWPASFPPGFRGGGIQNDRRGRP
jgi:hypothetical protein